MDIVIGNFLRLEQMVDSNIKAFLIEHQLLLDDEVLINLGSFSLSQRLFLAHTVRVAKTLNLEVEQVLYLSQESHPFVTFLAVTNYLSFGSLVVNELPSFVDTLELTQSVMVDVAKPANNTLEVVQSVDVSKTQNTDIEQTLGLRQTVSVYKPSEYYIS